MSKFKKGDYAFVKHGTLIDYFGKAENWAGEVTRVATNRNSITLKLDAKTLQQLTDAYLSAAVENGEDVFVYNFHKEDLVLGEPRDSNAEYQAALTKIYNRLDTIYEAEDDYEDEEVIMERLENLAKAFSKSDLAKKMKDGDQEDASFVADTFVNYAWRYVGENVDEWDAATVREVCLHYVVGKVSAPAEEFENYGKILAVFFHYLEKEGYISDSKELRETALEITPQIVEYAADPRNWHMAKSMFMPGVSQGLDLSDQDALNTYMRQQQLRALGATQTTHEPIKTIKNAKKTGRNDKVSVKYPDGKIVKDVKYKKVMRDVEAGKCKLI